MVLTEFDRLLAEFATKHRSVYSRYADDITFSNNDDEFPSEIAFLDRYGQVWIGTKLFRLVSRAGFDLNYAKSRLKSRKQRQEVTGITISGSQLNVRRKFVRNIRAVLYKWERFGYSHIQAEYREKRLKYNDYPEKKTPAIHQVIGGKLNYLSMVKGKEDPVVQRLRARFETLLTSLQT